jgi:hypothetical protein
MLCLLALAGLQTAHADDAFGRTLVGSWEVFITNEQGLPPNLDMTTVNRDGTLTNSDSIFGTGHGAWKRAGSGQFTMKFRTPILATASGPPFSFPFPQGSILTISATVTVAEDGMSAFGPYQAVVDAPDPDGMGGYFPVFGFNGDVAFSRITVD